MGIERGPSTVEAHGRTVCLAVKLGLVEWDVGIKVQSVCVVFKSSA